MIRFRVKKLDTSQRLQNICETKGITVPIIHPPLVPGPTNTPVVLAEGYISCVSAKPRDFA